MSDNRNKRAERRAKTDNVINQQKKIAKIAGIAHKYVQQPHRLAKHHALDCGNPGCMLCSNARKTHGERTIQERKFIEGSCDDAQND